MERKPAQADSPNMIMVLKKRLAAGEISLKEYDEIIKRLDGGI